MGCVCECIHIWLCVYPLRGVYIYVCMCVYIYVCLCMPVKLSIVTWGITEEASGFLNTISLGYIQSCFKSLNMLSVSCLTFSGIIFMFSFL